MLPLSTSSISIAESAVDDSLSALVKGDCARIRALLPARTPEQAVLRERLEELGFVAGESLRVVAIAFPSANPIAVRIGNTTFALRRHEAEMIQIDRQ